MVQYSAPKDIAAIIGISSYFSVSHQEVLVNSFYSSLFKKIDFSIVRRGFPSGSAVKESACNAGDTVRAASSIPGLGRSPGGNGNPLQYTCLKNPMDRGAWQTTVHGVSKSRT